MGIESFEVYYFQNGRWAVHATFDAGERELAIEEAKSVETKLGFPSKVVRETYYPETNTTEEVTTYAGSKGKSIESEPFGHLAGDDKKKKDAGGGGPARPSQSPRGGRGTAAPPSKQKRKPPPPPKRHGAKPSRARETPAQTKQRRTNDANTVIKLLFGIAASLLIACIGGGGMALTLFQMQEAGVSGIVELFTPLTFGTFLSLFLVSIFYFLNKQFQLLSLFGGKSSRSSATPKPRPMPPKAIANPLTPTEKKTGADLNQLLASRRAKLDDETDPHMDSVVTKDKSKADDDKAKKDKEKAAAKEKEKAKKLEDKKKKRKEENTKAVEDALDRASKKLDQKKDEEKKKKEDQEPGRKDFLTFITAAIGAIQADHPNLNAFTKFGLNLYLAGASDQLGLVKALSDEQRKKLLSQGIQVTGFGAERTKAFIDELGGYRNQARYTNMIQAGSDAMKQFMDGNTEVVKELSPLLSEWSLPEKRAEVPQMYTFLFTDIAGSTAMTQKLGNAGAQRVVRAHNTAVRNAIAAQNGREVKHTGDGIMAVFPDPLTSVAASVQILKEVEAHNAANPNLPLTLRIGVNTGEAVEEDNDFFGTAVQTAARICDKAADGQAWISESVVQGAANSTFKFLPRGEFEMKGIDEPKPLFEIAWSEKHRDEVAEL